MTVARPAAFSFCEHTSVPVFPYLRCVIYHSTAVRLTTDVRYATARSRRWFRLKSIVAQPTLTCPAVN